MTSPPVSLSAVGLWRTARVVALLATVVLLAGLTVRPELSLGILWDILIPLVPASLFLAPALWRNVCPLGTLNQALNRAEAQRPAERIGVWAPALGIVLLAVLVPARRFLFNTDGPVLAATVATVAVLALVLGRIFDQKSGYCMAICPVLPVERLYGQRPLLRVGNPHCTPCTLCATGCLDLAPPKSIPTLLGAARRDHSWLLTPFGAFAAAFPGFVTGYYQLENGAMADAGHVYAVMLMWSAGSWLATAVLVRALQAGSGTAMRVLAALAGGLYYWFGASPPATRLGLGEAGIWGIRAVALTLIAVWLIRPRRVSAPAHARDAAACTRGTGHEP